MIKVERWGGVVVGTNNFLNFTIMANIVDDSGRAPIIVKALTALTV